MTLQDNTESSIICPNCNRNLIVRTNRRTGAQFLGCANYPACIYSRPIPEEMIMRMQGQPELFETKP